MTARSGSAVTVLSSAAPGTVRFSRPIRSSSCPHPERFGALGLLRGWCSLWVGSTSGLIRLQNGGEQHFTTEDGLADDSVTCLTQSNDGSLFVGTKNGFSRVHAKTTLRPLVPATVSRKAPSTRCSATAKKGCPVGRDEAWIESIHRSSNRSVHGQRGPAQQRHRTGLSG